MTKYQVSYSRRDWLTIEVDADDTDDAVYQADRLLFDPNKFDIDEGDCELDDVVSQCDCCGEVKAGCVNTTYCGMDTHACPKCRDAEEDAS